MGKFTAIQTYDRFTKLKNANKINERSLNFILDTGQLYTHGIFLNNVAWGTETTGAVELTIAGVKKTLSLSNHTHNNYLEKNANIDLGTYKIVSGTKDLLYYSSGNTYLGNTSSPLILQGSSGSIKKGDTTYTILDTLNFTILAVSSAGHSLQNAAKITYGSSNFLIDYIKRLNTTLAFNDLNAYSNAGVTLTDSKYYAFITLRNDGSDTASWAQVRFDIASKTMQYRTSAASTTWYNVITSIPSNALNVAGIVAAPTSSDANKVWKTDASGNPGWKDDANTQYYLTLNGTVKGTASTTDLGTFYAIPTSDTSTANQVWMRNAANDGYAWRTLGDRAFDSTSYLPLTGGTLSGGLTAQNGIIITGSPSSQNGDFIIKNAINSTQMAFGYGMSEYLMAFMQFKEVTKGVASSDNSIRFHIYGHDNLFNILGSGNVGIGTTAPSYKLDVNGSANATTLYENGTSLSSKYLALTGGTLTGGYANHVNILKLKANQGTYGCSVGMTFGHRQNSDEYYTRIASVLESSSPNYLNPALVFYTMYNTYQSGTEVERMRIRSNGNVGIGTSTPQYTLDVNGSANATTLYENDTSLSNKYLALTGGTMTGTIYGNTGNGLTIQSNNTGSWKEGIRVYPAPNNYTLISLQDTSSSNVFAMVFNTSSQTAYFDYYKGSTGKVILMPYKDGTIALTSDLSSYLPLSGGTLTGNITIAHATSAAMTWGTTNPAITFSESGSQPVSLVYTDYDNYRSPAGLKVIGNQGSEWFESAGEMYAAGGYKVWHAGNDGSGSGLDADTVDGYHYNNLPYLPTSGGTLSGTLSFSNNIGMSGIMGGGTDRWGIVGTGDNDEGRLKIYVADNGTTDWLDFEFRDYTGTIYTPLSMTGNKIIFNYNPTVSGYSLIHSGNIASQSVNYASSAGNADTVDGYHYNNLPYLPTSGGTVNGTIRMDSNIYMNSSGNVSRYIVFTDAGGGGNIHSWNGTINIGVANSNNVTNGLALTPTELYTSKNLSVDGYISTNGDLKINGSSITGLISIELNSLGALSGYGGFIDFHYNGSSADYTSRIIEDTSGTLTCYANLRAYSYTNWSDIRLKNKIKDINIPLEIIARAPAFQFTWKNPKMGDGYQIGTSAQYWQTILPEVVTKANDDIGTLSLLYDVLALACVISIAKETLDNALKIIKLENRIKELEEIIYGNNSN